MPRYFFHVKDGRSYPDLQGTELDDLPAARREALRFSSALLRDAPETFWTGDEWSVTIANADGLTLFMLMFVAIDAPVLRSENSRARIGQDPQD